MKIMRKSYLLKSFVLFLLVFSLSSCGMGRLIRELSELEERSSETTTTTTIETFPTTTATSSQLTSPSPSPSHSPSPTPEPTTAAATSSPVEVLSAVLDDSQAYFSEPQLTEALDYFDEIAANSEFNGSKLITKWGSEIRIAVHGDYNEADMETLSEILYCFASIPGIPSVKIVETDANINMYFVPSAEMSQYISDYVQGNLGFFEVYWDWSFEIYKASIAISTDRTGPLDRKHLIWEELVQSLGLMNDSYAYEDSIFQQRYSIVQHPSALDFALLRMLYSDVIKPGFSGSQAVAALREQYKQ